ncbi:MAG TPA: hypothetical protein GXX14_11690 [Clostridiaceae bacterium]|nr:hypothetical protein [Clostridiaceae bacterium]
MLRQNFNAGWKVREPFKLNDIMEGKSFPPAQDVHLPHDYMILTERQENAPGGSAAGYYRATDMEYIKEFDVPAEWAEKKYGWSLRGLTPMRL